MVEHNLAKVGVAGSSPVSRFEWTTTYGSGAGRLPDPLHQGGTMASTSEGIKAALAFAAEALRGDVIYPLPHSAA